MLCDIFFEPVMDSPDWRGLGGPDGDLSDASHACTPPVLGLRPVFGSPVLGFGAGQTQARAAKGLPFSWLGCGILGGFFSMKNIYKNKLTDIFIIFNKRS
jgi:hypothetical protein